MIIIESKRNAMMIQHKYPNALIIDVSYSSISLNESGKLNPFYPHEKIPVPYTDGYDGISVSSVWNSLKVFEYSDVNINLRNSINIQKLRRENSGSIIGFRQGYFNDYIMRIVEARKKILIPMYRDMLEQKVYTIVQWLREKALHQDIVLLDDSTNYDINNINQPLSYAWLVKSYVEGLYPYENVYETKTGYQYVMVGQHSYCCKTDVKVLKEIAPYCCNKQFKIGFDYYNSVFE